MRRPASRRTAQDGAAPVWARLIVPLVLVLVVVLGVDYGVLASRAQRVDVRLPTTSSAGETWLIVGIDDRAEATDPDNGDFGAGVDKPTGARADVVVVVRPGLGAVSVSRDLLLPGADGAPRRLATTWWDGPQVFVDALCTGLGVPATHLAALDMRGFQTLVDTLGGVPLTLPEALRDRRSGLQVDAGHRVLDGRTALALVRSRQGEVLRDATWVPDPSGQEGREARTAAVLAQVVATARDRVRRDPATAQRLAWRVLPDLGLDQETSVADLARLRHLPPVQPLPLRRVPGAQLAEIVPETATTLSELGLTGDCRVGS